LKRYIVRELYPLILADLAESHAARHRSVNALAEPINGLYKAEPIHRRTWKTRESVELATLEWVAWFNHHRSMDLLGYIPPAEAEANYYRQIETPAAEPALT
jgi:putative transposase